MFRKKHLGVHERVGIPSIEMFQSRSAQESNDKSAKRGSRSTKQTKSKCSVPLTSSSSLSEDGDSSDSASENRRSAHRCLCQRISDVRDLPATSSIQSPVLSLQKSVSSVASKAVLD